MPLINAGVAAANVVVVGVKNTPKASGLVSGIVLEFLKSNWLSVVAILVRLVMLPLMLTLVTLATAPPSMFALAAAPDKNTEPDSLEFTATLSILSFLNVAVPSLYRSTPADTAENNIPLRFAEMPVPENTNPSPVIAVVDMLLTVIARTESIAPKFLTFGMLISESLIVPVELPVVSTKVPVAHVIEISLIVNAGLTDVNIAAVPVYTKETMLYQMSA